MTTARAVSAEPDPFLFDSEQLHAVAGASAIRNGLADFKDNRVTELDRDEARLWARVEDAAFDEVLDTELSYDADGNLYAACECGEEAGELCRHSVAALYAYAAQGSGGDPLLSAADSAIEERSHRGRTEVRVEPLGGDPWFGTWRATSVASASHFPRSYRVHIRSLHRRANYCSCPDFANNQLGTCKHIEAVLHRVRRRRDYSKIKDQPAPYPYVYLAWDAEDAPRICVHRGARSTPQLKAVLDDYFDAAGVFKGRLPEDFFRFSEIVAERTDIDLGDDAVAHARRLAAAVAREVRAREIRERIESSGGHLPGVRARLYRYQVEGAAFLAANGRALLADDMGLGKTLQAISAATWLRENADAERILVVCPASLKHQWAREIEKFAGLEAQVVQGPARARGVQYRRGNGFFIINYELVLRDLSVISEVLRPDLLILDEAQRIKNWQTKIASAVKLIPSRYAFVLTGTPLENRLEDLYSLMQVVDQQVLGPLWRYLIDFHVTDERGKVLGYRNLSQLRRRLSPVMLRRDRRLVRDQLPDRIEQRLDLPLTAKQRELHDDAMKAAGALSQIARRRPLTPAEQKRLMAVLQEARMACDAAGLVDKETEGSPKLDELATLLDELCLQSGLKAVVFSQWELMTRMVEQRLRRMGLGCVRLHGGVPSSKRGELMDRFRDDDAVQVFVSTDAGGVGLNLQSASVLINLDIPWNPAVLDQRIARVHRLGQTEKVQVILMVAADAYEERVLSLVQGKRSLFDNVVAPDATEDVVGVSKKLLETLVADLNEAPGRPAEPEQQEAPAAQPGAAEGGPERGEAERVVEAAIGRSIQAIQEAFGPHIERILGAGGGLLVVMDRVDEEADRMARELSAEVPVALIEPRILNGLERLGAASPVADARTYFDAAEAGGGPAGSRMAALARERLKAAEVLIGQQCLSAATELLNSASLAAAAARAELEQPPSPQEAGVWLYGEAMPKGWLTQDQAGLVMRAVALAQAPAVPEALLQELLGDVRGFVDTTA
jgi:superfamily II DNA or RNA helicase